MSAPAFAAFMARTRGERQVPAHCGGDVEGYHHHNDGRQRAESVHWTDFRARLPMAVLSNASKWLATTMARGGEGIEAKGKTSLSCLFFQNIGGDPAGRFPPFASMSSGKCCVKTKWLLWLNAAFAVLPCSQAAFRPSGPYRGGCSRSDWAKSAREQRQNPELVSSTVRPKKLLTPPIGLRPRSHLR